MTATASTTTKALWVALILTACLHISAIAADDTSTNADPTSKQYQRNNNNSNSNSDSNSNSSANSNPFGGSFSNPLAGFLGPLTGAASGIGSTAMSSATTGLTAGGTSLNSMADQYLQQYPEAKFLRDADLRDANNNALPGLVNPALIPGAAPYGTLNPPTPAAAMTFPTKSRLEAAMITQGLTDMGGFSGQQSSDYKNYLGHIVAGDYMARSMQYPNNAANLARAQAVGQSQAMSNAMGDMTKSQAASAIGYCSSYLQNFTTDDGNRWNKIRNGLFVPIAILLLLPGAVLTQVRAMAVAGNPVLSDPTKGDVNPFEGILRAVVAIFLIPGTYLVVNYGIDFSNSIVDSIAGTYQNVMGSNMYQDALGTEVNAFPVRTPKQNQNAGAARDWPQTPITGIPSYEQNVIRNLDPVTGQPIPGKTDEAMPAASVAARQLSFGANAGLTAAWNILCAFQMAYLGYLFFVGPIAAALWVWPMTNFRAAFPSWVEGVITLCFWSLFWNTAILLMACFKGSDDSTTMITSALNFLATASVKYAFDFASLVKAAGQQAGSKAMESANGGGKNGGAGGKGSQGKSGAANNQDSAAAAGGANQNQPVGPMPGTTAAYPAAQPANLTSAAAPSFANPVATNGLEPAGPLPAGALPPAGTATNASYYAAPALPPLAIAPRNGGSAVNTETTSLGNFTVSRSYNENGEPVDVLRAQNGQDIGTLPPDMSQTAPITYNGQAYDVARINTAAGTQYTLTNHADPTHPIQAMLPAPDRLAPAANMGGTLSGTGNMTEDSIALRSNSGTLLLEDGGNTVLLPSNDRNGYDAFTLQPGATEGTFTSEGRMVAISQNPNGERVVSLRAQNGEAEVFTVGRTGAGGYNVAHSVNGQPSGTSFVSTDGQSTYYARYSATGQLTDMDQINGNQINSTLYGDDSSLLGSVNTTYEANGNSESMYYQPDGTLTASATHMFKPEGGFIDTVRNSQGDVVSVQDVGSSTAAGVYAPVQSFAPTTALTQEYHSSASTTHNYGDDDSQYVTAQASPMATQAAALLHRDAQSAISHQNTSYAPAPAPAPVQAPTRARDVADVHSIAAAAANNQNSNMRSFRTISAILALTTPTVTVANNANDSSHQNSVGATAPAGQHGASVPTVVLQDQYAASAAAAQSYARQQYTENKSQSTNVHAAVIRNQNNNSTAPQFEKSQTTADGATNYDVLNSMLRLGNLQQARLILPIIRQELAKQHPGDATNRMVDAYARLLKQYNLNEEAQFINNSTAQAAAV